MRTTPVAFMSTLSLVLDCWRLYNLRPPDRSFRPHRLRKGP